MPNAALFERIQNDADADADAYGHICSSLTEVICVKISIFSENINHDRTTFFPAESHILQFLPH